MRRERAFITGMAGFVGSHLVEYLLENTDWDIYGFIRWNSKLDNLNNLLGRINIGDRLYIRNAQEAACYRLPLATDTIASSLGD